MKLKLLFFVLFVSSLSGYAQMLEGTYVISPKVNPATVIDITDVKFHNGNKLQVWEYYSKSYNQHFKLKKIKPGVAQIVTDYDKNISFDVPDGSMFNGNSVQIWQVYANPIQYWNLEHISGAYYVIRCNIDPKYVLTVDGNGSNGSKVYISEYTGQDNQIWALIEINSDIYMIFSQFYDKSIK